MSENELIIKASKGNVQAFETIIKKYERLIYSICYRMFRNKEDTLDICQEVYIKIYKNLEKVIGHGNFKNWVCTVTTNTCIDELRKRKDLLSLDAPIKHNDENLQRDIVDKDFTPEEFIIEKEKKEILEVAISKLSPDFKSIIILREIENYNYDEIAEILNINVGTVKSRLSRGRKKLQEIYLKEKETDSERRN
ncbi:MAG: RNA polymerase sigma factor [Lachnospirales bacterium]